MVDPAGQFHGLLGVALHPWQLAEFRTPVLEIAPQRFLVVGPEDEVLEVRIAERGIRLQRGTVKARGLQHHAVVEQGVGESEILHRLAAVVLEQGGEQADRLSRSGLGENPCGEGQLDVDARNLIDRPNDVRGLLEGSLIVEEMGQLLAGLPVGWDRSSRSRAVSFRRVVVGRRSWVVLGLGFIESPGCRVAASPKVIQSRAEPEKEIGEWKMAADR